MLGSRHARRAAGQRLHHVPLARLALALVALGLASEGAAEELTLPKRLPEVAATPASELGTQPAEAGLAVGAEVPEFALETAEGRPVRWKSLIAEGPVLVVFYRGGWCPYCNVQIRQLAQAYPEFADRDVRPVLISADRPDGAALAQRSYDVPFPVLSDPDLHAHEAFGVVLQVDAETVERYQGYGIDLERWSNRAHHKIALTSVFLVGRDGRVEWAHVSEDYKARPTPEQLLSVIDAHASRLTGSPLPQAGSSRKK